MTGKKRSIEARVAALFGQTAYREVWQGGGGAPELTVQDVAAAVGIVAHRLGRHAVMALETSLGRTEIHFEELGRAWEERMREQRPAERDFKAWRWGVFLALREMIGTPTSRTLFAQIAYNNQMRRESLEGSTDEARRWLCDLRDDARMELHMVLKDDDTMFEIRQARKRKAAA